MLKLRKWTLVALATMGFAATAQAFAREIRITMVCDIQADGSVTNCRITDYVEVPN